ncbi:MAG: 4Fe-4S binding protein [Bacillota bacterium]
MVERGVAVEGLKTRYHEVKVCGGAAGCPLTLADDRSVSLALAAILDASGLDGHMAGRIDGPVLFHHRFRAAVAGCPNACSQPQIVDFGVIAQSVPGRGEGGCTDCGLCVKACREGAVSVTEEGPAFDTASCLNCGQCIRSCPAGAIREAGSGFRVLAGGRLGRRPRLAEVVLELAGESEVKAALEGAVRLYMEEGRDGERFSALVERLGIFLKESTACQNPGSS